MDILPLFSLKISYFLQMPMISWDTGVGCCGGGAPWWAWLWLAGQVGRWFLPGCQSQPGHPLAPTSAPPRPSAKIISWLWLCERHQCYTWS